MKFRSIFLFFMFSFSGLLFSDNAETDKAMWLRAYNGDFSIVHKQILARRNDTFNDALMSQFAMAYVCYKAGMCNEVERLFKGIDSYIEYVLIPERE